MASAHTLPTVASLWVGDALTWLHELCLASYVHFGHEVVLFHTGQTAPVVPAGVTTRASRDIWDHTAEGHENAPAAMLSDLFRLHLMKQTDMIWIDTDMLCLRPMPEAEFYAGFEQAGAINGAVLRLPKDSEALELLLGWFADPEWVPHWLAGHLRRKIEAAPEGKRLLKAFELIRPVLGPRALTHTMARTGESARAQKPSVFYPIRGVMSDVLFSGYVPKDTWKQEDTLAVHLYASMVRRYHKLHRPEHNSFIARFAQEIGFDFGDLKHQSQGTD